MKRHLVWTLLILVAATAAVAADADTTAAKGVVNINSASSEQLQLLPRVGPALAERIIAFREVNGSFESTDELLAIKGIGERSFEHLRAYVVTEGDTTLQEKVRLPRQPKVEASQ